MKEIRLTDVEALILGHAVGDALGKPVEFGAREERELDPVRGMRSYGYYPMPAGTWSDNTSMSLVLLESLGRLRRVDYEDIMDNFLKWMNGAKFTATGEVFDVGRATLQALSKSQLHIAPTDCGGTGYYDNGNGSLMRLAPLAPYLYAHYGCDLPEEAMQIVHDVSALTHRHPRSQIACGLYVLIAVQILAGKELKKAIAEGLAQGHAYYAENPHFSEEVATYGRIWDVDAFAALPEEEIKSSGYVVDTWETVLYCLLTTDSYRECVLKAVNFGGDTDTAAAIAGGLAGLTYGFDAIPQKWLNTLLKHDAIRELCQQFSQQFEA